MLSFRLGVKHKPLENGLNGKRIAWGTTGVSGGRKADRAKRFSNPDLSLCAGAERVPSKADLGEGRDRPKLEALVRELGLEADVALPGFVENPYQHMKRVGVFVLSSRWEGLPTVLVEALARWNSGRFHRLPKRPGRDPRERALGFENGRWGLLVPVGNAEALAEAILSALNDKKLETKANVDRFTLAVVIGQYMDVLSIAD